MENRQSSERGASTTSTFDKVQESAHDVTETARHAIADTATSAVAQQRDAAGNYISSVGFAAQAAADSFARNGCRRTAEQLSELGELIEDAGRSISQYDVRSVVGEATRTAQRYPAVTFGLAALAGYALVKLANNDDRRKPVHNAGRRA